MRHPDAPRGDRLPGQGGRPLRARRRKQQYAARHICAARRIRSSAVCAVRARRGRAVRVRQGYAPPGPSWGRAARARQGAPCRARRGRAVRARRGYASPGPRRPRPPGIRPAGAAPSAPVRDTPRRGRAIRAHRGAAPPASAGAGPCARQAALIFVHASENTVTKSPRSWNTVQRSSTSCGGLNVSSALNSSSSSSSAALLGEQ